MKIWRDLEEMYAKRNLKNPAVIVDVNHSNSGKRHKEQIRIVSEILHSRNYDAGIKRMVKGVMIESYIEEGRQDICENLIYGKSHHRSMSRMGRYRATFDGNRREVLESMWQKR